ncbi:MAG: mechanosensitive ion channel domain-containing protein [Pseudomonadota bacterium]
MLTLDSLLAPLADIQPWLPTATLIALLIAAVWIVDAVARNRLQAAATLFARQTKSTWDDALVDQGVFARLAHLIPAALVYFAIAQIPDISDSIVTIVRNVATAYGIFVIVRTISAVLSAVNVLYEAGASAVERPIKGYIQITKLALYCIGAIVIVAALIDKSPLILLSGFGAMTAVLLLIFKDTILSLVASVQISSLDMIRVGDWIEMPQLNADGDVIDIALHTVRVQNWDKTITTIPTHRLISESFMNWRGMQQAGGRRIKRALSIDVQSVRFLSAEEIKHFERFALLKNYMRDKQQELDGYNAGLPDETADDVNMRRLTNLGTLRAYLINYLRHHPRIHDDMTLLVRQLQPGAHGIPIEIYCFTQTTAWAEYESIQADLFDHLLAILPQFNLRVYQAPSGHDFDALRPSYAPSEHGLTQQPQDP